MRFIQSALRVAIAALLFNLPWPATSRAVIGEKDAPPAGISPEPLIGIGVVLEVDGAYVKIGQVIPGGPADRDGKLKVNDRIAGIADGQGAFVDCTNMSADKVVALIRGTKGSTVRLQVIEPGVADPKARRVIPLVRDVVKYNGVAAPATIYSTAEMSAVEKGALDELVKKTNDANRILFGKQLKHEVDEVVQTTGLDARGRMALEAASQKAIDQSLDTTRETLLKFLPRVPGIVNQMLGQVSNSPEAFARRIQSQGGKWPVDQPVWKEALKQTLNPAQAAAWAVVEKKRRDDAELQMGHFLDSIVQFSIQQHRALIEGKASQVEAALDLPADREAKVKALAESVLNTDGANARENARKSLMAMGDEQRKAAIQQQGIYRWLQNSPDYEWATGIAALLTPAEKKTLSNSLAESRTRRACAIGALTLAMLDQKIAFTEVQRQQLLPILERLAIGNSNLVGDRQGNNYFALQASMFYGVANGANVDEIKKILDPVQMRHWRECCALKDVSEEFEEPNVTTIPSVQDAEKPHPAPEPEDVDLAISDYMQKKSAANYALMLAGNEVKAEDAARVAKLPPDAAERLLTAARGATEEAIASWNAQTEQMVRGGLGDATPDTIKQRLAGIEDYQFSNLQQRGDPSPDADTVWNRTTKAILSPDQSQAWKKEIDARKAFLTKASAGLAVCMFDEGFGLSAVQWAKINPLIEKIVNDYADQFGAFYSSNSPNAWYLQSFSVLAPLGGIPEKDMKAILTPMQWKQWTDSNEYSNANNMWQNIDRNRRQQGVNN